MNITPRPLNVEKSAEEVIRYALQLVTNVEQYTYNLSRAQPMSLPYTDKQPILAKHLQWINLMQKQHLQISENIHKAMWPPKTPLGNQRGSHLDETPPKFRSVRKQFKHRRVQTKVEQIKMLEEHKLVQKLQNQPSFQVLEEKKEEVLDQPSRQQLMQMISDLTREKQDLRNEVIGLKEEIDKLGLMLKLEESSRKVNNHEQSQPRSQPSNQDKIQVNSQAKSQINNKVLSQINNQVNEIINKKEDELQAILGIMRNQSEAQLQFRQKQFQTLKQEYQGRLNIQINQKQIVTCTTQAKQLKELKVKLKQLQFTTQTFGSTRGRERVEHWFSTIQQYTQNIQTIFSQKVVLDRVEGAEMSLEQPEEETVGMVNIQTVQEIKKTPIQLEVGRLTEFIKRLRKEQKIFDSQTQKKDPELDRAMMEKNPNLRRLRSTPARVPNRDYQLAQLFPKHGNKTIKQQSDGEDFSQGNTADHTQFLNDLEELQQNFANLEYSILNDKQQCFQEDFLDIIHEELVLYEEKITSLYEQIYKVQEYNQGLKQDIWDLMNQVQPDIQKIRPVIRNLPKIQKLEAQIQRLTLIIEQKQRDEEKGQKKEMQGGSANESQKEGDQQEENESQKEGEQQEENESSKEGEQKEDESQGDEVQGTGKVGKAENDEASNNKMQGQGQQQNAKVGDKVEEDKKELKDVVEWQMSADKQNNEDASWGEWKCAECVKYQNKLVAIQTENKVLDEEIKTLKKSYQEEQEAVKEAQDKLKVAQGQNVNLQSQIFNLKSKISQISKSSPQKQQVLKQYQQTANKLQMDPLFICFLDTLFRGSILQGKAQEKTYLISQLRQFTQKRVTKTRFLYQFDPENYTSFHKYLDRKSDNLLCIVRTLEGQLLGCYYSGSYLKGDMKQPTLLFSLSQKESFRKREGEKDRGMIHEDFFIIFGNSELRIRPEAGKRELFSNFGVNNGFFDNRGATVNVLLGKGDNSRTVTFESFEFYEILFEKNDK